MRENWEESQSPEVGRSSAGRWSRGRGLQSADAAVTPGWTRLQRRRRRAQTRRRGAGSRAGAGTPRQTGGRGGSRAGPAKYKDSYKYCWLVYNGEFDEASAPRGMLLRHDLHRSEPGVLFRTIIVISADSLSRHNTNNFTFLRGQVFNSKWLFGIDSGLFTLIDLWAISINSGPGSLGAQTLCLDLSLSHSGQTLCWLFSTR